MLTALPTEATASAAQLLMTMLAAFGAIFSFAFSALRN